MMREFDKTDWYGYAGAERFADGSEPLLDNVVIAVNMAEPEGDASYGADVIVDANGIGIYEESDLEQHVWHRESLGSKDADKMFCEWFIDYGAVSEAWLLQHKFQRLI